MHKPLGLKLVLFQPHPKMFKCLIQILNFKLCFFFFFERYFQTCIFQEIVGLQKFKKILTIPIKYSTFGSGFKSVASISATRDMFFEKK